MIINFKKAKEKIKEQKKWTSKKYFVPLEGEIKEKILGVSNCNLKSKKSLESLS